MKILMTRKRFMVTVSVLIKLSNNHGGMFKYYIDKNLNKLLQEYNLLIELEKSLIPTDKVLEFVHKQRDLVDTLRLNGVQGDLARHTAYKKLLGEYSTYTQDYDTMSNGINSFLYQKEEFEVVGIPHKHFPIKMDRMSFEVLFKFIEEDIDQLVYKYRGDV